jgi:hypothetical protein
LARAAVAPKKEIAMHEQWEYKLLIGHGLAQKLKDADGYVLPSTNSRT